MGESKISCGGFIIDDETLEEVDGVLKVKGSEFVSSNVGEENYGKVLGVDQTGDVIPVPAGGGSGGDEHFYWCTATIEEVESGGGYAIKITLDKTKEDIVDAIEDGKLPVFNQIQEIEDVEYGVIYHLDFYTCNVVNPDNIDPDNPTFDYDVRFESSLSRYDFKTDAETDLLVCLYEGE